jgi:hypothetical protein
MRLERTLVRALVVAATLLLGACSEDPAESPQPPTGTISGTAVSTADATVDLNATATVAGLPPATTSASGANLRFSLSGVPASGRVVVRVSSPGHLDTVKVVAVRPGATTFLRATLVPLGVTANVDTTSAAQVSVPNSTARVDLPANALVRADNGAAPAAPVTVQVTPVDPGRDPERMPGDFTTLVGDAVRNVESFGALGIQIRDAQDNRYNLAAGKAATIRIPVSSRTADLPASIPLFYLDEASGRWREEGSATLGGTGADLYYEGTVGHFSYWNADRLAETIFINGCVQAAGGVRARNRTVHTEGIDYTGTAYAWSNDNGEFRVAIRNGGRAVLSAQGGTESTVPVVVGPSSADITLPQCLVERSTPPGAPSIVVQPADLTVDELAPARLLVVADGSPPLAYQWRRNGVDIAGATGSVLNFIATAGDSGALYSVVVTNAQGNVASATATLTVRLRNAGPPRIVSQPQNATVGVGGRAVFAVTAEGSQPMSYRWRRNGVEITGATGPSYTTGPVASSDDGARFSVVVDNSEGQATSTDAVLSVTSSPGLDIYKRPLARLIAGTYGGCTNAIGQAVAPIVVTTDGDVTFDGAVIALSSSTSTLMAQGMLPLSSGWSFVDPAVDRSAVFSFRSSGPSGITVLTGRGTVLIRCPIATLQDLPTYRPTAFSLLDGTTGTLSCDVRRGSTRTVETLAFALSSAQVSLGSISFSLNAPLAAADTVTAGQTTVGVPEAVLGYGANYADQSSFGIGVSGTGRRISALDYVAANGDAYQCTGTRR